MLLARSRSGPYQLYPTFSVQSAGRVKLIKIKNRIRCDDWSRRRCDERSRNDVIVAVVFILHSISQSQEPSLIFFFCFFSHRSHLGPELLPFPWLLVQWCYTNNMSTEVCFNNIIFPPYLSSMSMTTYLFNFSLFILPDFF